MTYISLRPMMVQNNSCHILLCEFEYLCLKDLRCFHCIFFYRLYIYLCKVYFAVNSVIVILKVHDIAIIILWCFLCLWDQQPGQGFGNITLYIKPFFYSWRQKVKMMYIHRLTVPSAIKPESPTIYFFLIEVRL